jgi:hypothetical protein
MTGKWDSAKFVSEAHDMWMARIDDDIRNSGSDLDPTTDDIPPK